MKRNDFKQIKSISVNELDKLFIKNKDELNNLYIEHKMGKLKNTRNIFLKRKDIARILTLISEKRRSV